MFEKMLTIALIPPYLTAKYTTLAFAISQGWCPFDD